MVVRSSVYSSAHNHNAMRRWVNHLNFLNFMCLLFGCGLPGIKIFLFGCDLPGINIFLYGCGLPVKIFLFGCGFQIVNNRNHLLCCRKRFRTKSTF